MMMMKSRVRTVLIIDDDEDDALIVRDMLNEAAPDRYSIDWISDAEQALPRLAQGDVDIVLLDYRLSGCLGTDWIPRIKQAAPHTPVLLLTGQGEANTDRIAMALGAADYLVKGDFSAESLQRTLYYSIEREAVLDALSQSEEHYRHLFEDHPAACLIYDSRERTILACNQAALRLYGQGLANSRFDQLFEQPLQDWPRYQQHGQTRVPSKRPRLWQHHNDRGETMHVELVDAPFQYHNKPARLVVVLNKSLEVQSERQARESENALLQLLADSQDAVLALDEQQHLQYANPSAERLLGLETTRWDTFKLPLPNTDQSTFEWVFQPPGSAPRAFEVVRSITRLSGKTTHLLSMRDITERHRLEAQRRLMERSLESTSNGVVICDALQPDMPIIYVNAAFEQITGYRKDQVLGRNCRFLQEDDNGQTGVALIREALTHQQPVNTVLRNYRADGSTFWNDLFISPVQDETGEVTHFVGIQNDISVQRQAENNLAYNTSHDALTGLPNRALLEDRIRQGLTLAQRYHRTLAALYIDLDGFKPINDALGHARGDQILLEVSRRLQQLNRSGDTLARLSADEFVLLLPDLAQAEDCVAIIEQVLASLSNPYHLGQQNFHLTASVGIALGSAEHLDDPMSLVQQADLAMYEAKQNGKNQYSWYRPSLNRDVARSLQLRGDLQRAIAKNEFRLHYQPVHNLITGAVSSVEALLRWTHPELGPISPVDFIPIAETTGQIGILSDWVLEQACLDMAALNSKGYKVPIALNLSPLLFKQPHLAEHMAATVARHKLDCRQFELEVLESVMMTRFEQAVATLRALKSAGFSIAIDDFGTGFSSLSYLKLLPIQKLKVDRSFITDIIHDQDDAAIVRAIISMARHLGLTVVAEGVETEAQAAFLKREGCHQVQGFLYSAARSLDDLLAYLASSDQAKTIETEPGFTRNLLILDDDPLILKSLYRALRNQGFGILLANTADEAFSLLAREPVQVVLSDQRMPQMSGTEFLKKVRSLYPNTARIVLSGYTDLATVTEAINEGAIYQFLTKPWDDENLRLIINRAFAEPGQIAGST